MALLYHKEVVFHPMAQHGNMQKWQLILDSMYKQSPVSDSVSVTPISFHQMHLSFFDMETLHGLLVLQIALNECLKVVSQILKETQKERKNIRFKLKYRNNCLFVQGPAREFFTHMETSPLPLKGGKFLPVLGTHGH